MVTGFFDGVLAIVGNILWPLFSVIGTLIDTFQSIFYAFAGISPIVIMEGGKEISIYSGTTGAANDQGIVYYMLQSQLVKNIFISILILALFLLIIFTALAFIKNAYSSKQKTWQEIVGNTIKGLGNFIIVPVVSLLGVWGGNILLQAINGATSTVSSQNTDLGRQLFIVAAYNANRARRASSERTYIDSNGTEQKITTAVDETERGKIVGLYENFKADCNLTTTLSFTFDSELAKKMDSGYTDDQYAEVVDTIFANKNGPNPYWMSAAVGMGGYEVGDFYNTWNVNYILLAGGGVFILYALGSITFGMVKRLFTLILLFVISPAICAMYPLDDGSAVSKWKSDFIKNVTMAYSAVVGMNLFLSLVPIINSVNLDAQAKPQSSGIISNLAINPSMILKTTDLGGVANILIEIAALYMVSGFISTLSGYIIGGGDAYSEGRSLFSQSTGRFKRGISHAASGTVKVASAFALGAGEAAGRKAARRKYDSEHGLDKNDEKYEGMSFWQRHKAFKQDRKAKYTNEYLKDKKEAFKDAGTVGGGFFQGLGAGLLFQGLIPVGDWLAEKSGIGKASDIYNNLKKQAGDSKDKEKEKQDKLLNGEFGDKKLIRALDRLADELQKAGNDPAKHDKAMSSFMKEVRSSNISDKAFELALKDENFKKSAQTVLGENAGSLENMSWDSFKERMEHELITKDLDVQKNAALDKILSQAAIEEKIKEITKGSSFEKLSEQLAKEVDAGKLDTDLTKDLKTDKDIEIAKAISELATNQQSAKIEAQDIQARQITFTQATMEHTTDAKFASQLAGELNKLQKEMAKMQSSADMKEMSKQLSEKLQKQIDAQKDFARKFVDAMKQNQDAIVKELKKEKKDK